MPSLIKDQFRVYNTAQFIESLSEDDENNLYLIYGRPTAWSNEASPETANTSLATEFLFWKSVVGGKKILGGDLVNVIPRYDWVANTVYPYFDYGSEIKNFYVMTDEFNIYKCISNNRGAMSTTKPTSLGNTITQTADGYIWKYMYTVGVGDITKFLSENYIPVRTLTVDNGSQQWDVQESAADGAILAIHIANTGSNYSNSSNVIVTITGDGEGATATASLNTSTNTVSAIVMTSYGTGYTNAVATISGGGGSDALLKPLLGPKNGHGSDPVYEFLSTDVMLNIRLNADESGKLPVKGTYRQLGIVQDPTEQGTDDFITNTAISLTTDITVTGSGTSYQEGEYVYQGASLDTATFTGMLVDWNSANSILKVTNTIGSIISDTIFGANSSAGRFVSDVKSPDVNLRSGRLLYLNNIEAVTRNVNQTEDYRIVINF